MKLLPKKQDIDKAKNEERRKEIDSGIQLATRIDKLRDTAAKEEKQLKDWRDNAINLIQKEIDDYLTVKDNLQKQTEAAEVYRKKLLEPLDKEWEEVNLAKIKVNKELNDAFILKEQLKDEENLLEQQREEVSKIVSRITQNEKDTATAKEETLSLRQLAQTEYEISKEERSVQTNAYEKRLSEVAQKEREYEVAFSLIKIRENEVNEKEVDIIKREKHLESQQKALRSARETLKL